MAFTFLSRFRIKPDKETEFVALARRMTVLSENEPDTLAYRFFRLEEPGMFAVFESFTSEAGDRAHQYRPENAAIIAQMVSCMDGSYHREYLYDLQ